MRLYFFIRKLLRFATHFFFVDIQSQDLEKVPEQGPVILAANHPSSLLDSVLISTQLSRPVGYLASSNLFRRQWIANVYERIGTIPIYLGRNAGNNEQTFARVAERLGQGRCIGIFPEGQNSNGRHLMRIRSGTARMALEAESRHQFQLGLTIIPVGINFESRELFAQAVLLRFGDGIPVKRYQEQYLIDEKATIRQLTDDIEAGLRQQVMHIENRLLAQLVDDLGELYFQQVSNKDLVILKPLEKQWRGFRHWLRQHFKPKARQPLNLSHSQHGKQQISRLLNQAWLQQPELIEDLKRRTERYKDHLQQNNLRIDLTHSLDRPVLARLMRLKMTLYALFFAPIAAFGLLNNLLPYAITKLSARRFKDEATIAFAYFGIGFLTFSAYYLLLGLGLWQLTAKNLTETMIYLLLLPPTGFVCLSYRTRITLYRRAILLRTFVIGRSQLSTQLNRERRSIIRRLEELHHLFATPSSTPPTEE